MKTKTFHKYGHAVPIFYLEAKLPSGVKTKTPAFERGSFESYSVIQL